mmetsp:Transcript_5675/g.18258  ORF Transcript_5675/g.18258 Transcript_5675/m.18258 type:complete len:615 (-) Transcript_5675:920-2764(-)
MDTSSILFTSQPLGVASSRWSFQICMMVLAAYFVFRVSQSISGLSLGGAFDPMPTDIRLRPVGLRDPTLTLSAANAFEFGLARGGCILPHAGGLHVLARGNGTHPAVVSLPFPVNADGYYLVIPTGPPEADVVQWMVESCTRSAGAECGWKPAGASGWRGVGDSAVYTSRVAYDVPLDRGKAVLIDQRVTWPVLVDIMVSMSGMACCMAVPVFGRLRMQQLVVISFLSAFYMDGVLCTVRTIGYAVSGNLFDPQVDAVDILANFILAGVVTWRERDTLTVFPVVGANAALKLIYWSQNMTFFGALIIMMPMIIALSILAGIVVARIRALRSARRLVLPDQGRYDDAWARLLSEPAELQAAQALVDQVRGLQLASACPPRQFNRVKERRRAGSLGSEADAELGVMDAHCPSWSSCFKSVLPPQLGSWDEAFHSGIPGTIDERRPVRDLDQLFVQATAVHPLLIRKVQAWADASGGFFPSKAGAVSILVSPREQVVRNPNGPGGLGGGSGSAGGAKRPAPPGGHVDRDGNTFLRTLSAGFNVLSRPAVDLVDEPAPKFVQWSRAMTTREELVKWCGLKSPHRAVEKMTRSYGQVENQPLLRHSGMFLVSFQIIIYR